MPSKDIDPPTEGRPAPGVQEVERGIYLALGWFPPPTLPPAMGVDAVRPLSLGTYKAMGLMGLRWLHEPEASMPLQEETQEIGVYQWLHTVPDRAEISRALWSGSWRGVLDAITEPLPEVVKEYRVLRQQLLSMLEASLISIRPRPASKHDDTPEDVVGPSEFARRITVVARACNVTLEQAQWEVPLQQAEQAFHSEMRWHGQWTVPGKVGGVEVTEEEFEGFEVGALATPDSAAPATIPACESSE